MWFTGRPGSHMWFTLPHFLFAVCAFLNNVFPEWWIERGGLTDLPVGSHALYPSDFNLCGHLKFAVLCYRRLRRPWFVATNTEYIWYDSYDTWKLAESKKVNFQRCKTLSSSSKCIFWPFSLFFRGSKFRNHAPEDLLPYNTFIFSDWTNSCPVGFRRVFSFHHLEFLWFIVNTLLRYGEYLLLIRLRFDGRILITSLKMADRNMAEVTL